MLDLEAAYRVIAAPNPSDPSCSLFAPPGSVTADRPKVIGIYEEWTDRADPSVLSVCTQAIDYYRDKLGYLVVQIELPYVPEGQSKFT